MLDTQQLAESVLHIFSVKFLTLGLILGYLCWDRDMFGRAIALGFFSMIFNPLLKAIWKIPLPEAVHSVGWAFPSGHMQFIVSLLSVLFLGMHIRWIRAAAVGFVALIAICIHHRAYHDWFDIAGGIVFGLLSLAVYYWIYNRAVFERIPGLLPFCLSALSLPMLYALSVCDPTVHHYHSHAAQAGLLALGVGWLLAHPCPQSKHWALRLITAALAVGSVWYLAPIMGKTLPAVLGICDGRLLFTFKECARYAIPTLLATLVIPYVMWPLNAACKKRK